MSVLDKLATSLNRRDEVPNQELARKMYVEKAVPVIDAQQSKRFRQVIEKRALELEKDSQKKRVAKVLKKLP